MLYKNFGMTRQGRVVFYDYDEVLYLTDCNFRKVPEPRTPEDEMASEPWYPIGPHDVFPEEFGTFLLGNAKVRGPFLRYHADLLTAEYWQERQDRIRAASAGTEPLTEREKLRFVEGVGVRTLQLLEEAGFRTVQVGDEPANYPFVPGSQTGGLYLENVLQDGNDRQLAAVLSADDLERIARDLRG